MKKKNWLIFAGCFLACAARMVLAGPNLLVNGDFESEAFSGTDTFAYRVPAGWTAGGEPVQVGSSGANNIFLSKTSLGYGTRGCFMQSYKSSAQSLRQTFTVPQTGLYRVSFDYAARYGTNQTGVPARFWITKDDETVVERAFKPNAHLPIRSIMTNVVLTAGVHTFNLEQEEMETDQSNVYDNFVVAAVDENLLVNGDFELSPCEDANGQYVYGAPGPGWNYSGAVIVGRPTGNWGYDGLAGVGTKFGGFQTASTLGEAVLFQTFTVVTAGVYRLSFDYSCRKTKHLGGTFQVQIQTDNVVRPLGEFKPVAEAPLQHFEKDVYLAAGEQMLRFWMPPTPTDCGNIVDNVRIIPVGGATCYWTGTVDGDVTKPANWTTITAAGETVAAVPDATASVVVRGNDVNLQIPPGTAFACARFLVEDATLGADCDWRGLGVVPELDGTTLDLAGHALTLTGLVGKGTVRDSFGGETMGELQFDVAADAFCKVDAINLSGFLRLVKRGGGMLTFTGEQNQTGGTVLEAGSLNDTLASDFDWSGLLAHRWSFTNGSLVDAVGGLTATVNGTISHTADEVVLPGGEKNSGSLNLGANVLPPESAGVTIEIWGRLLAFQPWARIFEVCGGADDEFLMMSWAETTFPSERVHMKKDGISIWWSNTLRPFEIGERYYVSLSLTPNDQGLGGCHLVWSKRSAATGVCLARGSGNFPLRSIQELSQEIFALGWSSGSDGDAPAAYDEVRVWRTVLSEDQLAADAVHGPNENTFAMRAMIGERAFASLEAAMEVSEAYDVVTLRAHDDMDPLPFGSQTMARLSLSAGSRLFFDLSAATSDVAFTAAGGITLPEGADINDMVVFSEPSFTAQLVNNGKSIIAVNADMPITAEWVGAGDRANFRDPANWVCRNLAGGVIADAIPTNVLTKVTLRGNVNFSFPAQAEELWQTLTITNVQLTTDCDWRGLPVKAFAAGATIDVQNHRLELTGEQYAAANVTFTDTANWPAFSRYRFKEDESPDGNIDIGAVFLYEDGNRFSTSFTSVTSGPNAAYNAAQLFDSSTTTRWANWNNFKYDDFWVAATYAAPHRVTKYEWYTYDTVTRAPTSWRLQGSNDGVNWTDLDVQTNMRVATKAKSLSFTGMIKDGFASHGELRVTVPEGASVTSAVATLAGHIRLVKAGGGTLTVSKTGLLYCGGTQVEAGTLMAGQNGSAQPYGAPGCAVSVASNAVFELNAKYDQFFNTFELAGGTLQNTVNLADPGKKAQVVNLRLTADSTYRVSQTAGLIGPNYTRTTLDLRGHVLTVNAGDTFYLLNTTATAGTLVLEKGALEMSPGDLHEMSLVSAGHLHLQANAAPIVLANYTVNTTAADKSTRTDLTGVLQVTGRFRPNTDYFHGCELQNGAVLDLRGRNLKALDLVSKNSGSTAAATRLQFAEQATILVDVDTPQRFPEKRLLAWTETTAPASTVTFTLAPGMSGWLRKTSSGLYYENGLTLFVR